MSLTRPAPPAGMRWLLFSPSGRLSRYPFVLGWLFLSAVNGFFIAGMLAQPEESRALTVWSSVSLIAGLFTIWASTMLSVKRLHDIDWAGGFVLLLFVPMLSILMLAALCIAPGSAARNRYGDRTNTPQV